MNNQCPENQNWNPSESEAKKYVIEMIKNKIQSYGVNRDYPSINGTSKISPFLILNRF